MLRIKELAETILFGCSLVCVTLAITLGFLGLNPENSFYKLSFVFICLWVIFLVFSRKIEKKKSWVNLLFFIGISILLIISIYNMNGFELPLKGITYMGCILCMYICFIRSNLHYKALTIFCLCSIIGTFFFIYSFYYEPTYWKYTETRTIGNFNPQAIGSWAYIYYAALIIAIDLHPNLYKVKLFKLFPIVITILFLSITSATVARSATVSIVFLCVFRLLPKLKMVKSELWAYFISLFPLLTVLVSVNIASRGWRNSKGETLLDGRETIWTECFHQIRDSILFGKYQTMQSVYTHNIFMDHLIVYGGIFSIIYIICTIQVLRSVSSYGFKERYQYDAYIGFCGACLMASIEGMVFSTGCGGIFFYAFTFLFLANCNLENNKFNEKVNQ